MVRLSWSRVFLVVLVLVLAGYGMTAPSATGRTDVGAPTIGDTNWGH